MWEKIQSPVQILLTSLKFFGPALTIRTIAETVVRLVPEGCKMPFQNVWSQFVSLQVAALKRDLFS